MKKTSPLKWIYGYCKNHIWVIVLLSIISALIAAAFIVLALLSKQVIDIATRKQNGNILFYCVFFIVVICVQAVLNIINSNIRVRASGKIEMKIKQGLFNSLLKKQMTELNKYHSGEYINRLTSDIEIVVDGVIFIVPQAISMAVKIIAGLIVLIYIDALFTFILVVCGIAVFLISFLYRKRFKELHKKVQQTDGKTRSFIQECIENLIVIKSFTSEKPIINRLKAMQNENFNAKIKRNTVSNLANTGVYVMFTSGYYFILVWGAFQVAGGKMTFGSLTAFLQVFQQIQQPFKNISGLIPQYFSMIASAERLQEIESLDEEIIINNNIDANFIYKKMHSIEFKNVDFAYENELILKNATVSINKGEVTAIIGGSGAGKSTMIRLLLGLIVAKHGEIYIKTDDKNYTIDAGMRKLFSYVPQGNMILSGTIRENITFFDDTIEEKVIINASEAACIMDFISELINGLDTVIGERGIGLSEGQVQRIAIARALISSAPIILLDEATSALDSATETKLLNNLKAIKTKTCIFISHRENTILDCDRVIKIENNSILGDYIYG